MVEALSCVGVNIPSAEDTVVQFVQSNPNASLEDIASLIQSTGANLGSVANTLGVPMAEAQRAFDTAISAQSPAQTAANEAQAAATTAAKEEVVDTVVAEKTGLDNVIDYINSGQATTDQDIYREMTKQGIGVEQVAQSLGVPMDEATTRYTRAQELAQIEDIVAGGLEQAKKDFPNGLPDNLLKRYASETNQSIEQIATNMDNFGVSVDDMARATGIPLAEVQSAYNRAKGGALTSDTGNTVAGNEVAGGTGEIGRAHV